VGLHPSVIVEYQPPSSFPE